MQETLSDMKYILIWKYHNKEYNKDVEGNLGSVAKEV